MALIMKERKKGQPTLVLASPKFQGIQGTNLTNCGCQNAYIVKIMVHTQNNNIHFFNNGTSKILAERLSTAHLKINFFPKPNNEIGVKKGLLHFHITAKTYCC